MVTQRYTTAAIAKLTGALSVWLWIAVALLAALAGSAAYRVYLLRVFPAPMLMNPLEGIPGHEGEVLVTGLIALVLLAVQLVSGFLALKWAYRAARNSNAMANGVEIRPHWAIWWYFIPIGCLFMPFLAMSESWRVSIEPDRWRALKAPLRLRWWWAAHLASALLSGVGSALDQIAGAAGEVLTASVVLGAAFGIQAIATVLYIGVIQEISRRQTALISEGRVKSAASTASWMP